MQKIRYRLVYNRKKVLNAQGCALVQVEAKLNQRNIYLTTNIYLRPDNWNKSNSQVINHPQATELNAMLFEFVIHLQGIELGFWKRGIQPTLALLRDAVKKKSPSTITFPVFAKSSISSADKRPSTKENLMSTVNLLQQFRPGIDFPDLTYTFLKDFEQYMKEEAVLVDFFATWCGPCKMLSPVLESAAKTLEGKVKIVKVDVDQSPELAQKFGVMAVPTMILFKNGKQATAFSGYMPEAQLVARIEAAL